METRYLEPNIVFPGEVIKQFDNLSVGQTLIPRGEELNEKIGDEMIFALHVGKDGYLVPADLVDIVISEGIMR